MTSAALDKPKRPIKAVIFDMDGLLLDSETIYTTVIDEVLAPFNKQLTWEIKAMLMGRPAIDSARILIQQTNIPLQPDQLLDQMATRQRALFPSVKPMPGALELVHHLYRSNIPIAIATGSSRKNYELKTANLGELFEPFEGRVVCGDDEEVRRGKPEGDPFLVVARRHLGMKIEAEPASGFYEVPGEEEWAGLGIRPDEILVFEDGILGVQAAKAAAMAVVWVPDPELRNLTNSQHSIAPSADQVLDSLRHCDPAHWGLPPFPPTA